MDTVTKRLTRDDARRIVLALWLFLTVIWISYSFAAGLGSKVAFIPPALVVMLVMLIGHLFHLFHWLWKRSVIRIAGEYEPARGGIVQQQPEVGPRPTGTFRPIWGFARPSTGTVCTALLAVAIGACVGAVSNFDAAVFKKGTAIIPTKPSSVPTSADVVKPQSFSVEPKRAAMNETNPTIGVQTEAVKTESFSAGSKTQNTVTSFDNNNLAKQPEAQSSIDGQKSSNLAPAAAQQGQRDFPVPVPPDGSVLAPGKSNEWRAVSPRRDAWLSFYATLVRYIIFGQQSKRPIPRQTKVAESGVQSLQRPQITRVHVRERGTLNGTRRPTSRQER
jgi:hypothetical protein